MDGNGMTKQWRVGENVPLNVYEGARPVCQCHSPSDAARIVEAMNAHSTGPKVWTAGDTIPRDTITVFDARGLKWKRCVQGNAYIDKWGTTQAEPILLELFGPIREE